MTMRYVLNLTKKNLIRKNLFIKVITLFIFKNHKHIKNNISLFALFILFLNSSVHFSSTTEHLLFFYLCYFALTFSYKARSGESIYEA